MVSWKIALVVIVIVVLVVAIGMWFGYQYVIEQDDFSPEGRRDLREISTLSGVALTSCEKPPGIILPFPSIT